MRSLLFVAAPLLTAALLSSCSNPPPANTFAGNYAGTFAVVNANDKGDLSLAVSGDGSLSGTITLTSASATPKPTTSVSGTIQNDGTLVANYKYPGAFPTATLKGTVTLTAGMVAGTLNVSIPDLADAGKVTLNLTKK